MNRTIWIWRIIAIIVLLTCAVLMMNLYSRLTDLNRQQPTSSAPAGNPQQDSPEG